MIEMIETAVHTNLDMINELKGPLRVLRVTPLQSIKFLKLYPSILRWVDYILLCHQYFNNQEMSFAIRLFPWVEELEIKSLHFDHCKRKKSLTFTISKY